MTAQDFSGKDAASVREMLSGSGYADRAIDYFIEQRNMGVLSDADQVSELTGHCGDTMKIFLKVDVSIFLCRLFRRSLRSCLREETDRRPFTCTR